MRGDADVAQRYPDSLPASPGPRPGSGPRPCIPSADRLGGEVLAAYVGAHADDFLRALQLRNEDEAAAERVLRRSARRISAALHTYEPLVEAEWAEQLRSELGWLDSILTPHQRCAAQLARLRAALARLASVEGGDEGGDGTCSTMAIGAARAEALLERQLTLARTRARSSALQAFGSSRFHAVADSVTLLVSELPLTVSAAAPASQALVPLAASVHRRLAKAVQALPLPRAAHPYNGHARRAALVDLPSRTNAEAHATVGADKTADKTQDAPWHRARVLVQLSCYAWEVLDGTARPPDDWPDAAWLRGAALALDRHCQAADAATAAAGAARTPRITPATAYALGVLHGDQRSEVEAARYAFSCLWQGTVSRSEP
ncbi:MAG: CHAD domain-containing protein [Streptomycetaceae bacterium]|nr:CHAD domain-containing protein [Streptomycetaceae bacterium]